MSLNAMQTRPIDEATFSILSHDRVFSRKRSGKNRREEMTPRMRSYRRILFAVAAIGGSLALAYALWTPGLVVKDGQPYPNFEYPSGRLDKAGPAGFGPLRQCLASPQQARHWVGQRRGRYRLGLQAQYRRLWTCWLVWLALPLDRSTRSPFARQKAC